MSIRREIPTPHKGGSIREWAASIAESLRRLRVVPGFGLTVEETAVGTILHAVESQGFAWFYTTSAITTATASATGTALGSATMTDGTGTARPCKETGTGTTETRVPDTNAADVTIYNPLVLSPSIASGSFVRCAWINGRWELDMSVRCPGA